MTLNWANNASPISPEVIGKERKFANKWIAGRFIMQR